MFSTERNRSVLHITNKDYKLEITSVGMCLQTFIQAHTGWRLINAWPWFIKLFQIIKWCMLSIVCFCTQDCLKNHAHKAPKIQELEKLCVYIQVYMYICVNACVYMCTCMCVCECVCTCVCVSVCIHAHVYTCMCTCVHVCLNVCACAYVCVQVCMCVCCVCVCVVCVGIDEEIYGFLKNPSTKQPYNHIFLQILP